MKTAHEPILPYPFLDTNDFHNEIEHVPFLHSPTTTTTTITTIIEPSSTAELVDFIYPYRPSEESVNQFNDINKNLRCYPTHEVLKPLIGIENWCSKICVVHCPPTLCACVHI